MQFLAPDMTVHLYDSLRRKTRRTTARLSPALQWHLYTIALIWSDALWVALAFRIAFFVRFELALPLFQIDVVPSIPYYQGIAFLLIPIFLIIFAINGLYNQRNLLGGIREYDLLFRAVTTSILLVVVAGFMQPIFIIARGWLLLAWIVAFSAAAVGRFTLRRMVYYLRQHGFFLSTALIVGANEEACSLARQLLGWRTSGLILAGFVDDSLPPHTPIHEHLGVLGPISNVDQIITHYGVTELILATSALRREDVTRIVMKYGLAGTLNLRLSSGLYEVITTGLEVYEMGFISFVGINKTRMTGIERMLKFVLDYCCALLALLLLSPLLLLIALAIKLDSPGPILYRRRVVGLHGREFDAFKFRTMHLNGDAILAAHPELQKELARTHKLKDDPRVTRVGRVLRRLSLDEFPQLLNVLRHEMSLVGPRMITPEEMRLFGQLGMSRLTVLPGITGLWQVSGRSDVSYADRVRLDMYYIRNWTIWLDLQLLFQTIPAVLQQRGAY